MFWIIVLALVVAFVVWRATRPYKFWVREGRDLDSASGLEVNTPQGVVLAKRFRPDAKDPSLSHYFSDAEKVVLQRYWVDYPTFQAWQDIQTKAYRRAIEALPIPGTQVAERASE